MRSEDDAAIRHLRSPHDEVQAAMEAPGAKHGDVEAMARAVAVHAQKQNTKDDVSVVVLKLADSSLSVSQPNGRPDR